MPECPQLKHPILEPRWQAGFVQSVHKAPEKLIGNVPRMIEQLPVLEEDACTLCIDVKAQEMEFGTLDQVCLLAGIERRCG